MIDLRELSNEEILELYSNVVLEKSHREEEIKKEKKKELESLLNQATKIIENYDFTVYMTNLDNGFFTGNFEIW